MDQRKVSTANQDIVSHSIQIIRLLAGTLNYKARIIHTFSDTYHGYQAYHLVV